MKLSIAAAATLPLLASGYTMGGFNSFGRPVIITGAGQCGPRRAPSNADKAFSDLKNELNSSSRRGAPRGMTKEEAARQRDWLNRAFGLATEAISSAAGVDVKETNEALRQQQEWLGRAFGVDTSYGASTPRYDVDDSEEAFTIAMDVPGVKLSDLDINLEEDVLTISGEREVGIGEVTRKAKFSKSFTLDSTVEVEKITAKLNNGVLLVSAPKDIPVPEKKKIPILQVEDTEDEPTLEVETSEEAVDKDAPADDENNKDEEGADDIAA